MIELTPDAHPIHLHLASFQVQTQDFDVPITQPTAYGEQEHARLRRSPAESVLPLQLSRARYSYGTLSDREGLEGHFHRLPRGWRLRSWSPRRTGTDCRSAR